MQRWFWPRTIMAAGLALQFGVAPVFAQSTPATTPSTPPVTTPPPPAVHPPTGGPNSLPTSEPANAIEKGGVSAEGPGRSVSAFTEAQARSRLRQNGYREVSGLTMDPDGTWRGSVTRNGHQVHVALDNKGNISTN